MFANMLARALCWALAAVASLALASGPTGPSGRVRGEVTAPGFRPVPGATVLAARVEPPAVLALTATDDQGALALDDIPSGTFRIVVLAGGFSPGVVDGLEVGGAFRAVADVRLRAGTAAAPVIVLPPADGAPAALVRVVDDEGRPLAGVRVRLDPREGRSDPIAAETDQEGQASLGGFPRGKWRLTLFRAGRIALTAPCLEWSGGGLLMLARMLPLAENAPPLLEDLLPPPRLIPPQQ